LNFSKYGTVCLKDACDPKFDFSQVHKRKVTKNVKEERCVLQIIKFDSESIKTYFLKM